MSDQSPWGAPPPSNPYGTPAPPPGQPPYQPPAGGSGYGGGPPSYGVPLHQGPQGPQGPRKRTGLIVAIVAAVLLVAAAFTVTLVVAGGDDEPDEASSSDPTSQATDPTTDPTADPTTDPTTEPTDDPSSESTAPPADGDTITGDGYTYALPAPGWKEASDDARELAATIDTAIILGASIDLSQSSIIVEALSAGGATSVDDLANVWKRNLSSSDNATPVDIDETTIAGERAIGVRIEDRVNNAGIPITQVAYLTVHDGNQYSIGLSFPKEGDTVSEDDFETMLASWTWTS